MNTKLKVIAGLIGGCVLLIYLADEVFWSRMATLQGAASGEGGSGSGRTQYWMMTFKMLDDHPLGLGANGYTVMSPHYLPAEWLTRGHRAVHSLWFEVLSEYGYHGLAVFLGFVFSNFFLMRKVKRYLNQLDDRYHLLQAVALEASFSAFLVCATFINRFYAEMLYWLPAFMAAFASIYMIRPQQLSQNSQ